MRRLNIVLLVALAWLALPAAASAQAALTPQQFAAIDDVYTTFGAFTDDDGASPADRVAARAACTALGSADPLLSGLRRLCSAQLSVGTALGQTARCRGRAACLVGVRRVRRALNDLIVRARASNANVAASGLPVACVRELRVNLATLRYFTSLRASFGQLEQALRIRSSALARRAQRRIEALREPDARSPAQQQNDYRVGCTPPG